MADEAAWRLLAHVCQTPFYQRLRVELQLGYAVFSALRQIHGQTGLLFGVQSPSVAPVELLQHIQQFLNRLPGLIRRSTTPPSSPNARPWRNNSTARTLTMDQAAELLWQGKLAGRSSDYLTHLPEAILRLTGQPTGCGPTLESGRRRLALPGQQALHPVRLGKRQNDHYRGCKELFQSFTGNLFEILSNIAT